MAQLKETIGRIYLEKINHILYELNQNFVKEKESNKIEVRWSGQEAVARIILVLLLMSLMAYGLSFPISFFKYLFIILVIGITAICLLFFFERHIQDKTVKKYEKAVIEWKRLGTNLDPTTRRKLIQSFCKREFNRELRYGETTRIQQNVEYDISFRNEIYLFRDRMLSLKNFLFAPLFDDWDKRYVISKIIRADIIFTVVAFTLALLSISYVLQGRIVSLLYFYVMRGIELESSPLEQLEEVKDKELPNRKLKEKDLVIYKSNGQVHEWTDFSKKYILDKYEELLYDSTLDISEKECRKKARDKFYEEFSDILKKLPTLKTIWTWIKY